MDFGELHGLLEKLLECKQCNNRLDPPVFCCNINGHAVCKSCRDLVEDCPENECGDYINNNQQTVINNFVRAFRFRCKFSNLGCRELDIPDNLRKHEAECDYRTIQCILLKNGLICNDRISILKYGEHIDSCHDSYVIPYSVKSGYNTTLPKKSNMENNMCHYRILKDNKLYFLEMIYYDNQLKAYQISIHFIGKKSEASDYIYLIEIEIDNSDILHYKYGNRCLANIMTPGEAKKKCPLILFDENDRLSIYP